MYNFETARKISYDRNQAFWGCKDQYFFNKADCLRYATSQKTLDVKFHFFDESYSSLDWSREPSETLDQLYAERARQIRDKYDYVMLCYSGGSDTANILDTFLENNIRLDEIVLYYPTSIIDKFQDKFDYDRDNPKNHLFEYLLAALPKLQEVSARYPNIKINVFDYVSEAIENYNNIFTMFSGGNIASPVMIGHYQVIKRLREVSENQNACVVTGHCKPKLFYNKAERKYGNFFADAITFGRFDPAVINDFMPNIELFYHSKDFPQLVQKQCYVLKHVLDQMIDPETLTMKDKSLYIDKGKTIEFLTNEEFYKRILYKNWNGTVWQVSKTLNLFHMEQSDWFHNSTITDQRQKDYYEGQLLEVLNGIHKFFVESIDGRPSKFKTFISSVNWF